MYLLHFGTLGGISANTCSLEQRAGSLHLTSLKYTRCCTFLLKGRALLYLSRGLCHLSLYLGMCALLIACIVCTALSQGMCHQPRDMWTSDLIRREARARVYLTFPGRCVGRVLVVSGMCPLWIAYLEVGACLSSLLYNIHLAFASASIHVQDVFVALERTQYYLEVHAGSTWLPCKEVLTCTNHLGVPPAVCVDLPWYSKVRTRLF